MKIPYQMYQYTSIAPSFCMFAAWRDSVRRARLQQQLDFRLHLTSPLLLLFLVDWCHQAQSSARVLISSGPIYLPGSAFIAERRPA